MKTQCPNCKAKFNINETSVGKQAKCPKCANPFTIEPFIEMPAAVAAPAKSLEPVKPPAPAAPPVKSSEPVAPPVKSPTPIAPPAISAQPATEVSPESKSPSKAVLSKALFVYCWTGVRIIAGILGAFGLMLAIQKVTKSTLVAMFMAADVFLICSVAIEMLLFYKMWAAIQDDEASISPGKAVGFLFIPVFNIYWALLMVTGFAEDYNSFIIRRSIKTGELPMSLYLIYAFALMLSETVLTAPMLCIFGFLRYINKAFHDYSFAAWAIVIFILAVGAAHFITYILVAFKTCNAVNALPEKKSG
ncbi:MAG: zinc-ribbon domain-containing protein [Sedimentisphaerales bacterium]|jgi:predicted Zn finger-like uncharacterized protein